jgi:hypothetical protein
MGDRVEALKEVQLAIDSVLAENASMRAALRELDTGGGDYLTVRTKIAALSGWPSMSISVDEHLAKIKEKLKPNEFARFREDECWIYQGDGTDYPESLVCPVVMTAQQLRELLAKSEVKASSIENRHS